MDVFSLAATEVDYAHEAEGHRVLDERQVVGNSDYEAAVEGGFLLRRSRLPAARTTAS